MTDVKVKYTHPDTRADTLGHLQKLNALDAAIYRAINSPTFYAFTDIELQMLTNIQLMIYDKRNKYRELFKESLHKTSKLG